MGTEEKKKYGRLFLLVLPGAVILVLPFVILLRQGSLGDAIAVVLVWPVVVYTLVLSVANAAPTYKGKMLWRIVGGSVSLMYILFFWWQLPDFWLSFAIAFFGVVFAFLVELLAPLPPAPATPVVAHPDEAVA